MTAPILPVYTQNPPSRQTPLTFDADADYFATFISTMPTNFQGLSSYLDSLAVTVDANAIIALNSAAAAEGAANYKGEWSTLTGSLSIPASVSHNGTVWLLKANTGDATSIEPGVSTQWLTLTINASLPEPLMHLFAPNNKEKLLDGTLTTDRAGNATFINRYGVLQTATSNVLRVERDGALIEGAGTNLALYSEDLTNSVWAKTNISVTSNSTLAPDGTTTADKIFADNGTNIIRLRQSTTYATGEVFTISVFAKKAEYKYITIYFGSGDFSSFGFETTVDLDDGSGSGDQISEFIGNGWYKISITATASGSSTENTITIVPSSVSNSNVNSVSGDGSSGIFVWGAQVEKNYAVTSYIKTVASAATRVADDVKFDFVNNIPNLNDPFTFSTEINNLTFPAPNLFRVFENATNNFNLIFADDGTAVFLRLGDGSLHRIASSITASPKKIAVTFDKVDLKGYVDGVLSFTSSFNGGSITNSGVITLNNSAAGSHALNCNQKNIRFFDSALTADEVKLL